MKRDVRSIVLPSSMILAVAFIAIGCSYLYAATIPVLAYLPGRNLAVAPQDAPAAQAPADTNSKEKAHMDHKPKHGGTFFMALDNEHHLEGALLPGGIFRVYLYDDHTKPLKADQVKLTNGTIQIGESEDAPKIELGPGKKKETKEARVGNDVKFPVNITLLLHFPDMAPDAKPELFNFTFTKFTDEHSGGNCVPMSSMPNMCK
jgi:hypothetical protein